MVQNPHQKLDRKGAFSLRAEARLFHLRMGEVVDARETISHWIRPFRALRGSEKP
jgi:hypothetical protein